jgi:hypothetical protein
MSFRGLFSLGKGEQQAQGGTNNAPTARAPRDIDKQSWQSANLDDASAPNVGGQFGWQGGNVQFDLPRKSNIFGIGGSGTAQGPPAYISQYWEEGQGSDGATTVQHGRVAAGPAQCNNPNGTGRSIQRGVLRDGNGRHKIGYRQQEYSNQ